MSKNIIIYAHPNKTGFCGAILQETEEQLKSKGIEYEIVDLYFLNYDPVLKPEELYTAGYKEVSEQNKALQEKISEASNLIFIYPTWWNGMPAILKGFVDRVFTADYAFRYKARMPVGILKGKKAVVFTSAGAPRLLTKIFMRDMSTKVMVKHVLGFCGINSKAYYVSNAMHFDISKIKKLRHIVTKGLSYLFFID